MKEHYILLALLSFTLSASAQIVYVNNADTTLIAPGGASKDYDIDIDQNGAGDLRINMQGDTQAGYGNFTNGSFSGINGALKEPIWGDALNLAAMDSVGANSTTWTDFTTLLPLVIYAGGTSYAQEWAVPVTDGYFGFKFDISGSLHYGWMRIDVPANKIEMTIKDWAYEMTPNKAIAAGDRGSTGSSPPVASYTPSATSVCTGGSITFTDQSTNNPTSWNWTFNGGSPATSTSQDQLVTFTSAGVYDVTLIASNSNGSDTTMQANSITVNDLPMASVSSATNETSSGACDGTASVAASAGTSPYTYLWSPGGQTTATTTGLCAGSYTIVVTDSNGCADTTVATISTTIGIESNNTLLTSLNVYPNPSSGITTIEFDLAQTASVAVSLSNIYGQEIKREDQGRLTTGIHQITLDLFTVPVGVYFVQVHSTNNNSVSSKKIISIH